MLVLSFIRKKVTGAWRKLHNEKLRTFQSLSDNIRMIKLRGIRWLGHSEHMGEIRSAY
jgi:hypothetical protein